MAAAFLLITNNIISKLNKIAKIIFKHLRLKNSDLISLLEAVKFENGYHC